MFLTPKILSNCLAGIFIGEIDSRTAYLSFCIIENATIRVVLTPFPYEAIAVQAMRLQNQGAYPLNNYCWCLRSGLHNPLAGGDQSQHNPRPKMGAVDRQPFAGPRGAAEISEISFDPFVEL